MHKYDWWHLMITIYLVIKEKHDTWGSSNASFGSLPFFQKLMPFWFLKACFLLLLLEEIRLFPHLMTSLIWVVREFSELFILVYCISSGERTNSRSCILLHGVHLQLNSKEDGFTGIKPGVVTDVSEVPVWPGESFYCGFLLCSHPFCTLFAWEGKSLAWLVGAGLGICGETLQCLYMGHYIWKSWCYYSL